MLLCHVPAEAGGRDWDEPLYAYSSHICWEDVDVDVDGVAPGLKMGQQEEG